MRVISQDGAVDVPYETSSFNMICAELVEPKRTKRTNIYCHHSSIGVAIKIAEYSTKAKAIKAMEMCRKHYATAEYNRRIIPKGDTLVDMEIAKELLASGFIFQFPQDDEIEV